MFKVPHPGGKKADPPQGKPGFRAAFGVLPGAPGLGLRDKNTRRKQGGKKGFSFHGKSVLLWGRVNKPFEFVPKPGWF
jgi:hypothetical protein